MHSCYLLTLSCVSVSVEDILDEVSGLTVHSPDQRLEEGPRLILQNTRGHQEEKTCMETGQKVGYGQQKRVFDM